MRKAIIYVFFTFLSFVSFAQLDYSFDFVTSVDYTNGFSLNNDFVDSKYNYRVGGNFNAKIFPKTYIKVGLRFAQIGFVNKLDDLRWFSEIGPDGFVPDPSLPRYIHTSYDDRYIELPILSRYEFNDKKLGFFIELGVSPHLYLTTKTTTKTNITSTTIYEDTNISGKRIRMAYVFGLGLKYNLSAKFQLFMQPTFRFYPSNTDQFILNNQLRSFGIEVGVRRGFYFAQSKEL